MSREFFGYFGYAVYSSTNVPDKPKFLAATDRLILSLLKNPEIGSSQYMRGVIEGQTAMYVVPYATADEADRFVSEVGRDISVGFFLVARGYGQGKSGLAMATENFVTCTTNRLALFPAKVRGMARTLLDLQNASLRFEPGPEAPCGLAGSNGKSVQGTRLDRFPYIPA